MKIRGLLIFLYSQRWRCAEAYGHRHLGTAYLSAPRAPARQKGPSAVIQVRQIPTHLLMCVFDDGHTNKALVSRLLKMLPREDLQSKSTRLPWGKEGRRNARSYKKLLRSSLAVRDGCPYWSNRLYKKGRPKCFKRTRIDRNRASGNIEEVQDSNSPGFALQCSAVHLSKNIAHIHSKLCRGLDEGTMTALRTSTTAACSCGSPSPSRARALPCRFRSP